MSRVDVDETIEEHTEARQRVEAELLDGILDLDREMDRLDAVAEETRFTILYLLATDGRLRSGELADLLDRRQNDLYHHLDRLEGTGLVGKSRADDGTRVYEHSPLAERLVQPVLNSIRERASAVSD